MKQLYTLLILLAASPLWGQTKQIEVIASAGGYGTVAAEGFSLSWTLGEVMVETVSNSGNTLFLTQGFQQGSLLGTNIDIPPLGEYRIAVYPNPAVQTATIAFKELPKGTIEISVYSLTGALVHRQIISNADTALTNQIPLQIGNYKPGLYLVRVSVNGQSLSTLKLVKE